MKILLWEISTKKTIQKILSAIDELQLHKKATIQKEANLVFFSKSAIYGCIIYEYRKKYMCLVEYKTSTSDNRLSCPV